VSNKMSTSTTTSQPEPPPTLAERQQQQFRTAKRNFALAAFVLCPTIALLPPRKLDLYTFALSGAWLTSANHITKEYSGRSIWQRLAANPVVSELPTERAREMQRRFQEARREKQRKGALEKVWMGNEDEDWKEKRLQREQEVLDKGEGYGTLIMDQIREVWKGQKKENEGKGGSGKSESGEEERKT
jgi:hypothetical protein